MAESLTVIRRHKRGISSALIHPDYFEICRYYSDELHDHMYNSSDIPAPAGYRFVDILEGLVAKKADIYPELVPLYSYYNETRRDHFLTTDYQSVGIDEPGKLQVGDEIVVCYGILGYVFSKSKNLTEHHGKPVYRYFLSRMAEDISDHLYTINPEEIGVKKDDKKGLGGYICEGIAWHMINRNVIK